MFNSISNPITGIIGLASSYKGDYVYALTKNSLYVSKDFGFTFTLVNVFTSVESEAIEIITSQDGASIIILTKVYIYKSINYGQVFNLIPGVLGLDNPSSLTGSNDLELFYFLNQGVVIKGNSSSFSIAPTQPTDDESGTIGNVYSDGGGGTIVASLFSNNSTKFMITTDIDFGWENSGEITGNTLNIVAKTPGYINFLTAISTNGNTLSIYTQRFGYGGEFILRDIVVESSSVKNFTASYLSNNIIIILEDSSIYSYDALTDKLTKITDISDARLANYSGDGSFLIIETDDKLYNNHVLPPTPKTKPNLTWLIILLVAIFIIFGIFSLIFLPNFFFILPI